MPVANKRNPRAGLKRFLIAFAAALLAGIGLIAVVGIEEDVPTSPQFPDSLASVRASSPDFERLMSLYTQTRFEDGNHVEVLLNGDGTFPRLWGDLRSAKKSISVQVYFMTPGAVTDTLAQILMERARAGVRVRALIDAFGGAQMTNPWRDSLGHAGVNVSVIRPLKWRSIFNAANRSHARAIVVDGRIAYAGGFGFADKWLGKGRAPDQWRETNVRVVGPLASQLQAAFAMAWFEASGEMIAGDDLTPDETRSPSGATRGGVLFSEPTHGTLSARRFLALAIMSAEHKLYIENSYFVPPASLRQLLVRAAKRGVDVRIVTAGTGTDVPAARSAARYRYPELIDGGVRMYEYQAAMLHAKTIIVDGVWSSVGSMNFDTHSLAFNDEANVVLLDSAFAGKLERVFLDDLKRSYEMTRERIERRSVLGRFVDWVAVHLEHFL